MPLKWSIDHAKRMVTVTAEGQVTLTHAHEYLDAVVVGDAQPYAKLFDSGNMEMNVSDDDMMALGARMSAYSGAFAEAGPVAFIATTLAYEGFARRFLNVSSVRRPARLFKTVAEAKAWLATQPK